MINLLFIPLFCRFVVPVIPVSLSINNKDNKLLDALKSKEAFEEIFKQYYAPLVAYACKYVTSIDVAREIVQDFFVRLYEKRQTLTIGISLKSYLYRSVFNCCINYINQRNIQDKHLKNIDMERDNEDNLESEMDSVELQYRIFQIIDELPAKCQRIFKMNRLEGLKNEEIALQLNLSKRTVETQISKALKTLRKKLADYMPESSGR